MPALGDIPLLGSVLFDQAPTVYLACALTPLLWLFLFVRIGWRVDNRFHLR